MIKLTVDISEDFLRNLYKNGNAINTDRGYSIPNVTMPNYNNHGEPAVYVNPVSDNTVNNKIEKDLSEITKAISGLGEAVKTLSENVVTKDTVEEVVSNVVARELENKIMTEEKVVEILDKKLKDFKVPDNNEDIIDIKKELEELKQSQSNSTNSDNINEDIIAIKKEIEEFKKLQSNLTTTDNINLKEELENLKNSIKEDLITNLKNEINSTNSSDVDVDSIKEEIRKEFEEDYKKKVNVLEKLHQEKLEEMKSLHMNQVNQLNQVSQMNQMSLMNIMNQINPTMMTQGNPQVLPTHPFGNGSGAVERIEEKEEVKKAPSKATSSKLKSMMDV